MAERTMPGLGLTAFWDYGANFKAAMDTNLRKLSAVTQLAVLSRTTSVPGSPSNGDMYLITGATNQHSIAIRDNGAWVYLTPSEGWWCFVRNTNAYWYFTGTEWVEFQASDIPVSTIPGVVASSVQEALVKLSDHIDFLDEQLRLVGTEAGYTVPDYIPPS